MVILSMSYKGGVQLTIKTNDRILVIINISITQLILRQYFNQLTRF